MHVGGEESVLNVSFLWVCFLGLYMASEHIYT